MKGLILAAGRGSRLGSLTADAPKALTNLAGKELIKWQMDALQKAGIMEIGIVGGYLIDTLRPYSKTVFENKRWSQTNMVGSLLCADEWLSEGATIISYSDIVYHPEVVGALKAASADVALTYDKLWFDLWSKRFSDPLLDAEGFKISQDQRILSIGGKVANTKEIEGQYMGLLKFTSVGWGKVKRYLNQNPDRVDKLDMTSLLNLLIQEGVEIKGVPVQGRWCEVDTLSDLNAYEDQLKANKPWTHDWR